MDTFDYLQNNDNLYRTSKYIVKQNISTYFDTNLCGVIISDDTYYLRTPERDTFYEEVFDFRGEAIDGKRMKADVYRRKYVD